MPLPELTDEEAAILVEYARKRFGSERWPYSVEMRPIRDVLDKLTPKRPPAEPPKVYAPPQATAKQRR